MLLMNLFYLFRERALPHLGFKFSGIACSNRKFSFVLKVAVQMLFTQ